MHTGDIDTVYQSNGTKMYLPLVYMDTGDLVQNRIDFIDDWDTMFELNVVENSYWYTPLISIVVIIVSIVIAYFTGLYITGAEFGAMNTTLGLFTMGGALSGIGSVSGNKILQIAGILMTLGASIEVQGAEEIAKEAMLQHLPTLSAQTVLEHTSFVELFKGFVSGAGFGNLLNVGSSAFKIYSTATAPSADGVVQNADPIAQQGMMVARIDDEDEKINRIINKPLLGIKV